MKNFPGRALKNEIQNSTQKAGFFKFQKRSGMRQFHALDYTQQDQRTTERSSWLSLVVWIHKMGCCQVNEVYSVQVALNTTFVRTIGWSDLIAHIGCFRNEFFSLNFSSSCQHRLKQLMSYKFQVKLLKRLQKVP